MNYLFIFNLLLLLLLSFAPSAGAVTYRALIFGLGEQEDASWAKINGDNDVFYVKQLLMRMGYTDIVALKNRQATKAAMVKAFYELINRCHKGDHVYIHYSGHGQLMTDLNGDEALKWQNSHAAWDEAWIPYDAYMTYGPNDHGEKHLCDDEVAHFLQAIREKIGKHGELTVVIDACHSGDATSGVDKECVRGVDMKFNIPRQLNQEQGVLVEEQWRTVSACKAYQLCSEMKEPKVGKLTFALYRMGTEALKANNAELERRLNLFMDQYQGRIKQTPIVSGKKK